MWRTEKSSAYKCSPPLQSKHEGRQWTNSFDNRVSICRKDVEYVYHCHYQRVSVCVPTLLYETIHIDSMTKNTATKELYRTLLVPSVLCTRDAAPVKAATEVPAPPPFVADTPLPGPGCVEETAKVDVPSTMTTGGSLLLLLVGRAVGTEKTWPLTETVEPPGATVCEPMMKFPALGSYVTVRSEPGTL